MPPSPNPMDFSLEFLRRVVASSSDCIKVLDPAGNLMSMNESGQKSMEIADLTPHLGTCWTDWWQGEARGAAQDAVATALRGGTGRFEAAAATFGGTPKWWDTTISPMVDADGQVRQLLSVSRDITERKRAEQALQAAMQEAEHARAQAEAANAAKDHFLAVLSHELRTPLMPVNMALATLSRRADLPPVVRQAHEMIRRNVELEARFIDDLLDVTRIAHGKLEIVRADMNLREAVRRAVEVCTPDIEAKAQRLTVTLEPGECQLQGDFTRLQQVFWNLLKNASKFTPEGGAIEVRSRCQISSDHVVEVTDTGIGMEAETIKRIFQSFEQANVTITRQFGGLGLGLAIAKATVEAHGGTLRASSPGQGQGATFTVALPRH